MATPTSLNARRFVLTHRRIFAAAFAGLAVLFALGAVTSSPQGVKVVVASHDLASGTILGANDLRTTTMPAAARPAHANTSITRLLGRGIAGPMRSGEAFTDFRLLNPGLLKGFPVGQVIATVRPADSTQLTSLAVGDHVNVIASDPQGEGDPTVVARRAQILALPKASGENNAPAVVLVVPEETGLRVTTAALKARISVLAVP